MVEKVVDGNQLAERVSKSEVPHSTRWEGLGIRYVEVQGGQGSPGLGPWSWQGSRKKARSSGSPAELLWTLLLPLPNLITTTVAHSCPDVPQPPTTQWPSLPPQVNISALRSLHVCGCERRGRRVKDFSAALALCPRDNVPSQRPRVSRAHATSGQGEVAGRALGTAQAASEPPSHPNISVAALPWVYSPLPEGWRRPHRLELRGPNWLDGWIAPSWRDVTAASARLGLLPLPTGAAAAAAARIGAAATAAAAGLLTAAVVAAAAAGPVQTAAAAAAGLGQTAAAAAAAAGAAAAGAAAAAAPAAAPVTAGAWPAAQQRPPPGPPPPPAWPAAATREHPTGTQYL